MADPNRMPLYDDLSSYLYSNSERPTPEKVERRIKEVETDLETVRAHREYAVSRTTALHSNIGELWAKAADLDHEQEKLLTMALRHYTDQLHALQAEDARDAEMREVKAAGLEAEAAKLRGQAA